MLIRLSIRNFRSIKEEQEFSMEPFRKYKEHQENIASSKRKELLRSGIIYGANASGKSNVLKAFKALEHMVLTSTDMKPGDRFPTYEPFSLSQETANAPVELEAEFIPKDGYPYRYSISYRSDRIEKEELAYTPKNKEALLFSRKGGKPIKYGDHYRGERKLIEKQLNENQLFLSKAVLNNVQELNAPYSFFRSSLLVLPFQYGEDPFLKELLAERFVSKDQSCFRRNFNSLIRSLDTGVKSLNVKKLDPDYSPFTDEKKNKGFNYDIKAEHQLFDEKMRPVGSTTFDFREESDGTQRLFTLGGLILNALEHGATLVIDEFEKRLHPHVSKFLIQLFHRDRFNPHGAQLIMATHDMNQLDNEIFRRDQVWFTQKDAYGGTQLYSLADHKGVRANIPFDKWYDSGRFEGVPNIDDLEFELSYGEEKEGA